MVNVENYLDYACKLIAKAQNLKGDRISKAGDFMKIKHEDIVNAISNITRAEELYLQEKEAWETEKTNLLVQIQQLGG